MIRIIAKKDGFRRAGMAHYGIRTYPDDYFTPEQLKRLKSEPNLVVEEGVAQTATPEKEEEPGSKTEDKVADSGEKSGKKGK